MLRVTHAIVFALRAIFRIRPYSSINNSQNRELWETKKCTKRYILRFLLKRWVYFAYCKADFCSNYDSSSDEEYRTIYFVLIFNCVESLNFCSNRSRNTVPEEYGEFSWWFASTIFCARSRHKLSPHSILFHAIQS